MPKSFTLSNLALASASLSYDVVKYLYVPSFSMTCGSDLAGETAAALAASSVVYRNMGDEALADEALSHARELFDFANNCRDVYTNQIPAADFYKYAKLFYS